MTNATRNDLNKAKNLFDLLCTVIGEHDYSEFRICMIERNGKEVPVLVYIETDDQGNMTGFLPMMELLISPSNEVEQVLSYEEGKEYASVIFNYNEEDECPETLERSPGSYFISSSKRKH